MNFILAVTSFGRGEVKGWGELELRLLRRSSILKMSCEHQACDISHAALLCCQSTSPQRMSAFRLICTGTKSDAEKAFSA